MNLLIMDLNYKHTLFIFTSKCFKKNFSNLKRVLQIHKEEHVRDSPNVKSVRPLNFFMETIITGTVYLYMLQ
jgi:hypothetical protein